MARGQVEHILRFEEVVNEHLLNCVLIARSFGDLRVVQRRLVLLTQRIELANYGPSDRDLPGNVWRVGRRSSLLRPKDVCVIVVAVLYAVDDEGRINFIGIVHMALVSLYRLPSLGLTESVLHGRSLHVVQDALLSHTVAAHGRWRCQVLGQRRPNGKGVL